MKIGAIMLNPRDNVATALEDLEPGRMVDIGLENEIVEASIIEAIPFGHKFAVTNLDQGATVLKYGEVIGRTTEPIPQGSHAHVHNIESLRGRGDMEDGHGQ